MPPPLSKGGTAGFFLYDAKQAHNQHDYGKHRFWETPIENALIWRLRKAVKTGKKKLIPQSISSNFDKYRLHTKDLLRNFLILLCACTPTLSIDHSHTLATKEYIRCGIHGVHTGFMFRIHAQVKIQLT